MFNLEIDFRSKRISAILWKTTDGNLQPNRTKIFLSFGLSRGVKKYQLIDMIMLKTPKKYFLPHTTQLCEFSKGATGRFEKYSKNK
uniref:Uncharacterized protein n=1 Tax=Romanomermis culicivorax TaxID=13658 RepID=A0A915I3M3_ROMCU